jgi:hypothetical protein
VEHRSDQQLIDLATSKRLSDPAVMEAQVARMLMIRARTRWWKTSRWPG